MKIGSHVSMAGKRMYAGAAEDAHSYGETTFMVYTGAPQNTRRKPVEELNIEEGQELIEKYGMSDIVVHAPYIINLANTTKPETFELAVEFLTKEILRTEALGVNQIVLHPGAHVGAGADVGIARIIEGLNQVLHADQTAQIALETMAGKGTEIGRSFDELARIMDGVTHSDKLSVTLDTCHVNDAGYNIKEDFDGVLNEFDKIVGLDRLKVLHINDSKNERGAGKDRHANIGFGTIGFEALNYIVHHPQLTELPKILETPFVGEDKNNKKAPYRLEIEMFKKQTFDPDILAKVLAE
ncbi:deoxyribonuclease IV [Brochothrix thermosphacta]|uniref:deoxyribonuclease IV n=1 Tax=Brochothrix thermosphacta TaxID=2756 RepID=UPI00048C9634|nr:deoxyribonuclease IV [Brochothrix thermosphacta]ODJ48993.1 deoxyribonuclease IV [Brochothrix thermosphacta DSM 20171 = FSL F6-1036]ODJ60544.1 deoxyribonuclease IV [Brochothrix thermosphacta]